MLKRALKLKQASAVLKVEPKELQNLVQFGVVKPKRVDGTYLFDRETLLTAKVAFRLKESLGTRANVLLKLIDVFRASENVPAIVDDVIRLKIPYLWLQDEVIHDEAIARARAAGVKCIQNDCIFREHSARPHLHHR